jgi:hypothetical protein
MVQPKATDYPGAIKAEDDKSTPQVTGKLPTETPTPAGDEPSFDHNPSDFLGVGADKDSASPISMIDEPIDPAMLDEYNSSKFYHAMTPDSGVSPSKIEPLARSAFGRYVKEVGVAHDGAPIRFDWYGMNANQRNGWRAVAIDLLQNIGYIRG